MTSDSNRKLDAYLRRKRLERSGFVFVLALALGLFIWTTFPNQGPAQEVHGDVVRLAGRPSDDGTRLYLLVRLDSGEEVRARIPTTAQYREAGRVRLHKHEPRYFGKTEYRFQGYLDSGS